MDLWDVFRLIGSLAGVAALLWRAVDEFGSYLRISLKVDMLESGWVTALATVDNKGTRSKKLEIAFLLIGPEDESPIETANIIFKEAKVSLGISHTSDLFDIESFENMDVLKFGCRMILPLRFFYLENDSVSDETLAYRAAINVSTFPISVPISARFFISDRRRLHRSTHDCFVLTSPSDKPEEV